jgi:hypothetical protein
MSGTVSCEAADIDSEQVRPVGTSAGVDAEQVYSEGAAASDSLADELKRGEPNGRKKTS